MSGIHLPAPLCRLRQQVQWAHANADDIATKALSDISASLDEAVTMIRCSVHHLDDDGTDFETQITDASHTMDATNQDFAVSLDCSIKDAPVPVTRCVTAVTSERTDQCCTSQRVNGSNRDAA